MRNIRIISCQVGGVPNEVRALKKSWKVCSALCRLMEIYVMIHSRGTIISSITLESLIVSVATFNAPLPLVQRLPLVLIFDPILGD